MKTLRLIQQKHGKPKEKTERDTLRNYGHGSSN